MSRSPRDANIASLKTVCSNIEKSGAGAILLFSEIDRHLSQQTGHCYHYYVEHELLPEQHTDYCKLLFLLDELISTLKSSLEIATNIRELL